MTTTETRTSEPGQQILDELEAAAAPTSPIETLITRALRHGTKRAKTVAVRIRHDADLLEQILAQHGEEAVARRKVERLRAQLDAAEAELRAKTAAPLNIARLAGPDRPAPAATTRVMRAWLLKQGHEVADRGRLTVAQIDLYETAHQGGDQP